MKRKNDKLRFKRNGNECDRTFCDKCSENHRHFKCSNKRFSSGEDNDLLRHREGQGRDESMTDGRNEDLCHSYKPMSRNRNNSSNRNRRQKENGRLKQWTIRRGNNKSE